MLIYFNFGITVVPILIRGVEIVKNNATRTE